MKRIGTYLLGVGILLSFISLPVEAQGVWEACGSGSSAVCADQSGGDDMIRRVVNALLIVLGALAVIMIIWSGYKFVIARGDPANVKTAKDTLLYSVIGLMVALLAFAIVNIVINATTSSVF